MAVMTKEQIAKEAESFFEWPEDAPNRNTVTLTSCLIFAKVVADMARDEERKRWNGALSLELGNSIQARAIKLSATTY